MAGTVYRLLDTGPLSGAKTQEPERAFDGGPFKQLNVMFYLLALATTAGTFKLRLEHAAVNEDEAFEPFKDSAGNAVEVDLGGGTTGKHYFEVNGFLRFVRWVAIETGTSPTSASIVGIDLVGKE